VIKRGFNDSTEHIASNNHISNNWHNRLFVFIFVSKSVGIGFIFVAGLVVVSKTMII